MGSWGASPQPWKCGFTPGFLPEVQERTGRSGPAPRRAQRRVARAGFVPVVTLGLCLLAGGAGSGTVPQARI